MVIQTVFVQLPRVASVGSIRNVEIDSMAMAITRCLYISIRSLMHCPKGSLELQLPSLPHTPCSEACSKPEYEINLSTGG